MSRYNPGELVSGKYRIVRLIGDGGMGVVYEARHEVLGSCVALKFLHADLAKRPGLTQRFLQEARVSATIQSSHVTHVTDVDTAQDGSPYLVMELLSGQSLQSVLDRQGRLFVDQAVDFTLQILAGLEAAHALGVVHRDMKPDNVFVTSTAGGPLLKLIDFGIAKLRASSEYTKGLTRAGVVMGTPEYMAPEQLMSAQTTDHRADIYSVGVMLFEMLAGCRPADGDDAEIIVAAVEAGRVRKLAELVPGLPPALVALVERATRPAREERFESAAAMRLSLGRLAGQLSHAGRLAATAEPLAPMPTPASAALFSVPAPPMTAQSPMAAAPPTGVPKTVPPEGPPLSVSQLGQATTSLSDRAPPVARGTEMGSGASPYGPPPTYADYGPGYATAPHVGTGAQPIVPTPPKKRRSGLLLVSLVVLVLGAGGAVGYAAYQAADQRRVDIPPLPDASALPIPDSGVENIQPDNAFATSGGGVSATPLTKPSGGQPTGKPPVSGQGGTGAGAGGAATGGSGTVVIGSGGGGTTIQLPFPIPSGLQIPTSLPSSIQLPPGISFPPGFPGLPQQAPGTPTASPAPTSAPTSAPPTTQKRPRPSRPPSAAP